MKNTKIDTLLICIICFLIALLFVGTAIGLPEKNKKKSDSVFTGTVSSGKAIPLNAPKPTDIIDYFQLDTIRVITAQDPSVKSDTGTVLVINAWLAYPQGDSIFYEELARKRGVIKNIFSSYFSTHTKNELSKLTEAKVTEELLEQINEQLSLGNISNIFFTNYIFLE